MYAWKNTDFSLFERLVNSTPERQMDVIANKGDRTKYYGTIEFALALFYAFLIFNDAIFTLANKPDGLYVLLNFSLPILCL